jgi:fibronectin type 3 domain-containing protein
MTGLYTAPSRVPAAPVTVTAESSASPTASASSTVTITQTAPHSVSLNWSPSTSSVAGYNVYRSAQAAGPFTKINSNLDTATVYTDNSVLAGRTYYYAITAVASAGLESTYSNITQAIIP